MSASSIGASERRTEDKRFITGRGQYTDDIRRPYQTHACFLRSQHAHATIKGIDFMKAAKMPGVLAIYTGADIANDKIGDLICGWMVHSKDGCHEGWPNRAAQGKGDMSATRRSGDRRAIDQDRRGKRSRRFGVLPAVADSPRRATPGAQFTRTAAQHDLNVDCGEAAAMPR